MAVYFDVPKLKSMQLSVSQEIVKKAFASTLSPCLFVILKYHVASKNFGGKTI